MGGATASLLVYSVTASDGLESASGKVYSFKFRATNSIGNSDYSEVLRVALGNQ